MGVSSGQWGPQEEEVSWVMEQELPGREETSRSEANQEAKKLWSPFD